MATDNNAVVSGDLRVDEDEMKLSEDEDDLSHVSHNISSLHTVCCIEKLAQSQTFIHHCSNCKHYATATVHTI